jgi:hypothetical protein
MNNFAHNENFLNDFCKEVIHLSLSPNKGSSASYDQIRLAGQVFRLYIPNSRIKEIILGPLQHLLVSENIPPFAKIYVWDSYSTGVELPKFPWDFDQTSGTPAQGFLDGETIFFQDQNITFSYQVSRQNLSIVDQSTGSAVFWAPGPDRFLPLDGHPLRSIFQWFLDHERHQVIHAAGVGFEYGGIILTGKSGAGKSTTTLACLNSPLSIAGDENVILSSAGTPMIYSMYNSVNVDKKSLALLPFFEKQNVPVQEDRIDKTLFYLHQHFPDKMISSFPLTAIVVSRIHGEGQSYLKPLSAAAALTALAPTSIFQIPGNKKKAFLGMSSIIKKTPCYELTIGESLHDIPPLLIQLINSSQKEM